MVDIYEIENIAHMLESVPVLLYPVCAETLYITAKLNQFFYKQPTLICDRNTALKVEDYYQLSGLKITSIERAYVQYPNAKVFIASRNRKYEIIGEFVNEKEISPHNIINYEDVEKKRSCLDLEQGLFCGTGRIGFCCMGSLNNLPKVDCDSNYESTFRELETMRQRIIHDLSNGATTSCDGCTSLVKGYFPVNRKVREVNYSSGGCCNFRCCYCSSHAKKGHIQGLDLNAINQIVNANNLVYLIANGEIAICPDKNQIIESALSHGFLRFHTNASICDPKIAKVLEDGKGIVSVSVDAGTRKTFEVVKGVDQFEKVSCNLADYSGKHGNVVSLHYIILPGINDDAENILGFVRLAQKIKAICVYLSNDFHDEMAFDRKAQENLKFFILELRKAKIYTMLSVKWKSILKW